MPNDLGSTLSRVRATLGQAGATVMASPPASAIRRRPKVAIAILAAVVAVGGVAAWLAVEGLPDWAPFSPKSLAEHAQHARKNPRDAGAQRELGHAEYAAGRHARALASYGRALALDAGSADGTLVDNVVACFGDKDLARAEALVSKHKLAAAAKGLEPLTKSSRHAVRWAAVHALRKLGKDSRTVYANAYIADLSSSDCDVRRRAMEKLAQVGDRSALSAIRRAKSQDEKTGGWLRGTCLGDRDAQTEKAILARR